MSVEQSTTTAIDKIGFMISTPSLQSPRQRRAKPAPESRLETMRERMRFLVCDDPILVRQGQRDIVEALEQALLVEGLDLEMRGPSEVVRHGLLFEIDRQPIRLVVASRAKDMLDVAVGEGDRQKAVLEAVVVEDIREA